MFKKIVLVCLILAFAVPAFADEYRDLAEMYKKSNKAEKKSDNPRTRDIGAGYIKIDLIYYELGMYKKAATYLNKSINLKEALRLTATEDVRRDYLASQIYTYQFLTSTYIRNNKPEAALDTIEFSRGKHKL